MPPTAPRGAAAPTLPHSRPRSSGRCPHRPSGTTARGRPGRKRPFRGAGNCATSLRRAAGGGQQSRQTGCRQGRGSNEAGCRGAACAHPPPLSTPLEWGTPIAPAARLPAGDWAGAPLQGRGELRDQPATGCSRRRRVSADGSPSRARLQAGALQRGRPRRPKRHDCPRAAGAGRPFRGAGNCATSHGPPAPDALGGQAPSARPSARRNPSVVSLSRTARRSHSSSRPGNVSPRRVA